MADVRTQELRSQTGYDFIELFAPFLQPEVAGEIINTPSING